MRESENHPNGSRLAVRRVVGAGWLRCVVSGLSLLGLLGCASGPSKPSDPASVNGTAGVGGTGGPSAAAAKPSSSGSESDGSWLIGEWRLAELRLDMAEQQRYSGSWRIDKDAMASDLNERINRPDQTEQGRQAGQSAIAMLGSFDLSLVFNGDGSGSMSATGMGANSEEPGTWTWNETAGVLEFQVGTRLLKSTPREDGRLVLEIPQIGTPFLLRPTTDDAIEMVSAGQVRPESSVLRVNEGGSQSFSWTLVTPFGEQQFAGSWSEGAEGVRLVVVGDLAQLREFKGEKVDGKLSISLRSDDDVVLRFSRAQ